MKIIELKPVCSSGKSANKHSSAVYRPFDELYNLAVNSAGDVE